ncbi:MAG: hypothetical protein ABL983_09970, partial [Nitrospira sp.]
SIYFFRKLDCNGKLKRPVAQSIWYRGNVKGDNFELRLGPGNAWRLHFREALCWEYDHQRSTQGEQPEQKPRTMEMT